MNGGMRAATAIGVGYLLGRRKKFRTATLMAAATAVGGTTVGGLVLRRGMKMLGSTEALNKIAPQLGELTETVRGDLLGAGKAAASAAVSNRVDALTDTLHGRAERMRNPEAVVADGADTAASAGRKAGGAGKRAAAGAGGAARRAAGRGGARARDEEDYESDDGYEADEADQADQLDDEADYYEDADEPDDRGDDEAPPRRSAARRRSPVTRARR
jgi:hypothetical protein